MQSLNELPLKRTSGMGRSRERFAGVLETGLSGGGVGSAARESEGKRKIPANKKMADARIIGLPLQQSDGRSLAAGDGALRVQRFSGVWIELRSRRHRADLRLQRLARLRIKLVLRLLDRTNRL